MVLSEALTHAPVLHGHFAFFRQVNGCFFEEKAFKSSASGEAH